MPNDISNSNSYIYIKGAKVHNLKNIDVAIPRGKFVVVTGLSGSGKSSLAFDTLYAEGQRRYVESLSAYARQFLGRINKPDVEYIKGIPPAIAIEQKVNTRNPRSTVGTSTEIYDYLKLLFARIGITYSPETGEMVKKHNVSDVINFVKELPEGTRITVLAPFEQNKERTAKENLEILMQQGFTRIDIDKEIYKISDLIGKGKNDLPHLLHSLNEHQPIVLVIDRLAASADQDTLSRLADSVETAFFEAKGTAVLSYQIENERYEIEFTNRFEQDGIRFDEPSVNMFSFNNPLGACPVCEGFGKVLGIDKNLVVPDKSLSVYEDAIACWKGEKMSAWRDQLVANASKFDFPIHKPYSELTEKQRDIIWTGNRYFEGLNSFFAMLEAENYKIQFRVMLSRYKGKTICPDCGGTRLKKEAGYVKINDKSIHELVLMPITDLRSFVFGLVLSENEQTIAKRILIELRNRIEFLVNVGLGYLTLNRLSSTLSGGESQRINLATSLGSSLVGSLYILDEPSIGLHSRDSLLLIQVLRKLQQLGNTVLVVEHDEDIILAADEIIDVGPLAGRHGGEIVFQGNRDELMKSTQSLTTRYISGEMSIKIPDYRRKWNNYIEIVNAAENNLKRLTVKFPLNTLTVVTGVSGSGKSTLVRNVLYSALNKHFNGFSENGGKYDLLRGDLHLLSGVEFVDQNPIGKSSRSNPVTYVKAYDEIRKLFSDQQSAKVSGFTPAHFSFNVEGGRCEECQGEGTIKVEMQFMADVTLLCESCHGKRFKDEVLEIEYRGKSIHDVLELTIEEAIEFFAQEQKTTEKKLVQKLQTLADVGLGYIKLGQASSTLSGGESQRIKLASFLTKENENKQTIFIFDEPTTGLHFHDIHKLMKAFDALIAKGNTILIIEHNMDVIKCADWIIDIGKEGGEMGGNLVFEGIPEDLIKCQDSYTGQYLIPKLKKQ